MTKFNKFLKIKFCLYEAKLLQLVQGPVITDVPVYILLTWIFMPVFKQPSCSKSPCMMTVKIICNFSYINFKKQICCYVSLLVENFHSVKQQLSGLKEKYENYIQEEKIKPTRKNPNPEFYNRWYKFKTAKKRKRQ